MSEAPEKKSFRSGMVSIVGRPNVGKSTLLNLLVGEKVAIVSKVPQTTRNKVRGIYRDERGQIVFIDTPGLVPGRDKLDHFLKKSSLETMHDVDCVIHLVDTSEPVGPEEEELVRRLRTVKGPVLLGLNKIDLKGKFTHEYIELWEKVKGKPATEIGNLMPIILSGKTGVNTDDLLSLLFERIPEGEALYPDDMVVDVPQKMMISDLIREKFLNILRQELPHSIAVFIEHMEPRSDKLTHIKALVMVEKESQKMIVIGKDGKVLKKVGTQARREIEELIGTKVFLEIYVKVEKNWRDNDSVLFDLGYYGE
ncbi:MAG: GTPase Era [Candidatus Omnitrophota bacterium]|nr:GTPase Era [Candidatus Omnitrophota bacterium]MDZ4243344.1 GTPase Era [Candidatus Omnitrophota bacterium]